MYNVYCHQNKVNGMRYIGVTSQSLEKRAGYGAGGYRSTPAFYRAIQEYGWDAFSHTVLAVFDRREDAMKAEKEYIQKYAADNPAFGYNRQRGGYPHTDSSATAHEDARVSRIRATLTAQRSSTVVREEMSNRMRAVWADPKRRADIVARRSKKARGGRTHYCSLVVELDKEFETAADLADFLQYSKGAIWARFRRHRQFTLTTTPRGYTEPITLTIKQLNRGV